MKLTRKLWIAALVLAGSYAQAVTLRVSNVGDVQSMDPHSLNETLQLSFTASVYEALVGRDKQMNLVPLLATKWTQPSPTVWRFELRKGVKFHDGTPFTADDVVFSFTRAAGDGSDMKGYTSSFKVVRKIDDHTVEVETNAPYPILPDVLTNVVILSKKWCTDNKALTPVDRRKGIENTASFKANGTGPFIFVEHVKGSHVSGKKNPDYFRKGLPYLDTFKGVFTLQAAAMLNALQGGQVLAEFRGVSPAERDRIVQAMGDKIRVEESSWTLNLLVVFNTEKKPFDDVRVRKALLMAIDRWGGSQGLSRISTLRSVGGVIRPGSPMATPEADLVKLPGFSKDIKASREEAKKLLAEAGVPNLKFTLWNRNLAMPYTPAGIFLVDQWRQIGVEVEHKQSDTAPYLASMNSGNFDVAIDFSNLFMDDSSLGLAKYLSLSRAPENRSRSNDPILDKLFDDHMRERDPAKRKAMIQAFEKRLFEQAYQQPLLWWHRIVLSHKTVMGWKMSPSHNLGSDLATVWLNQ